MHLCMWSGISPQLVSIKFNVQIFGRYKSFIGGEQYDGYGLYIINHETTILQGIRVTDPKSHSTFKKLWTL